MSNANPITHVAFEADQLCLAWADGLLLRQSLGRYGRLQEASAQQRQAWRIAPQGSSVLWPGLGEQGLVIEGADWIWEHVCEQSMARLQALDWDLERLPERDQAIVALWRLEADGYNGGFLQFFCNWGERSYQLALDALQALGATRARAVVERQRQTIGDLQAHPPLERLWDIPERLSDEQHELISGELDEQLWTALEEVPALAASHFYLPACE
ncbi:MULTISPECIES: DUF4375 domain-containing protein [unclassified Pseudomonas]|uniref:DMP19 family protein n=1 Tax=unclassified Pseudomonas TaxID=196821 RepID=UPI0008397F9B|nr:MULTISPECIES: DUF4375 domain-containing protein [unclassified Pseudomonas]QIH08845.1 DUF4375 domain-containing protein [Pseudomonas sp. BIOMIG1BAC]